MRPIYTGALVGMRKHITLIDYTAWHYSRAFREGWRIWTALVWFAIHLFAIPLHLKTLFTRFRKLGEPYPAGFQIRPFLSALLINTVTRIMGVLMRLGIIIIGLVAVGGLIAAGIITVLAWIAFPAVVLAAWTVGILLILGV